MATHPTGKRFFNRELSWLEFNQRVLEEANEPSVPVLDRLFFLSVTAGNLDEFYMVRVGGLHLQIAAGLERPDFSGLSPIEQLRRVRLRVRRLIMDQYSCLNERILPALRHAGACVAVERPLGPEAAAALEPFFRNDVYSVLTPVAVDAARPFPLLTPLALYVAVALEPQASDGDPHVAVLRLTGGALPRLVRVPRAGSTPEYALLEDVVRAHLPLLFPGRVVREAVVFRITRNADMAVNEEYAADLASAMSRLLAERRIGPCVRLELEAGASAWLTSFLRERLAVDADDVFELPGPVDLAGLRELRELMDGSGIRYPAWPPQPHPLFDPARDIFEQIAERDLVLTMPYERFDPVLRLIEAAAADAAVRAIKIVLYRTSSKGPIIRALAAAAASGKQVTAVIELKARFDEARNIDWARDLEEAGVQVVYGVKNLKTHAKVCLVVRSEEGCIRQYLHFGTGNYNETTARLYTDIGLLTCDPALARDAVAFFHAITGYSEPQPYLKLVQAPSELKDRLIELIRYEADQAARQQPAQILAKMNALAHPDIIEELYRASQAGVEIRLCVRGVCCLRPGVKGLSENITVVSVIDRLLEHSRLFWFLHGGQDELWMSSADWMLRNLERRIELMVPIVDKACRRKVMESLESSLADNVKSWALLSDGEYERVRRPHGQRKIRSQEEQYEKAALAARQAKRAMRTVYEPHVPPR